MHTPQIQPALVCKLAMAVVAFFGSMQLSAQSALADSTQTLVTAQPTNIDLTITPGAAKGWLVVVIDNRNTGASCIGGELSVMNNLGEKVYQTFVNTPKVNLDISKLKPGTYILQFTFEHKVVKKEWVIE